jgi:hypothetical protein
MQAILASMRVFDRVRQKLSLFDLSLNFCRISQWSTYSPMKL